MDEIQKKLVKMLKDQPSCTDDRKTLRALLLDLLPQDKLQQNLILNAYDEDIVDRLKPSSDVTLRALQMVKTLTDGYGITKDSAVWAVVSWCHMLGTSEIADVIATMIPTNGATPSTTTNSTSQGVGDAYRTEIGFGRFAAGYDIPEGVITISPIQEIKKGLIRIWVYKGRNRDILADVKDSCSLELKKGEYLYLEQVYCDEGNDDYRFTVTKRQ